MGVRATAQIKILTTAGLGCESPREWKRNKRRLAILTKLRLEAFKLIEKLKVGGGKEYFVKEALIRGERFSRPSHLRA